MINATEARSGKSHRDENFPVASRFIRPRHRAPILAFYRFVRAADDVADHPRLEPAEKLALLDALDAALTGSGPPDPEAEPLKAALSERGLPPLPCARSPRRLPHGRDQAALRRIGRS